MVASGNLFGSPDFHGNNVVILVVINDVCFALLNDLIADAIKSLHAPVFKTHNGLLDIRRIE